MKIFKPTNIQVDTPELKVPSSVPDSVKSTQIKE